MGIPSSCKRDLSQVTSVVALARALYSASMLKQATIACLRQLQEIRLGPKNMQ